MEFACNVFNPHLKMEFMYLGTSEISESLLLDKTSIKDLGLCLFPLCKWDDVFCCLPGCCCGNYLQ